MAQGTAMAQDMFIIATIVTVLEEQLVLQLLLVERLLQVVWLEVLLENELRNTNFLDYFMF